jgi:hypothetical protein
LSFITAPDYANPTDSDTNNIYQLNAIVTDNNGASDTKTIKITITDVNENTTTSSPSTPASVYNPTLIDYNNFSTLDSNYIFSLLNNATTYMINDLTSTEAIDILTKLDINSIKGLSSSTLLIITSKISDFSKLDSKKVLAIINTLPESDTKKLPLTVKNGLTFALSTEDFLTIKPILTNSEVLINMANMPLNDINAKSEAILMTALNMLSGAEIKTLGADKIAELINKVDLKFDLIPDSKVIDIISNIPIETFSKLDSKKIVAIMNTIPKDKLSQLPTNLKTSLSILATDTKLPTNITTEDITITVFDSVENKISPNTDVTSTTLNTQLVTINKIDTGSEIKSFEMPKENAQGKMETKITLTNRDGTTKEIPIIIDTKSENIVTEKNINGIVTQTKLQTQDGKDVTTTVQVNTNGTTITQLKVIDPITKDEKKVQISSQSTDTTININKDGSIESATQKGDTKIKANANNSGILEHTVEKNGVITKATSNILDSKIVILESGAVQTSGAITTADNKLVNIIVEGKTTGEATHTLQFVDNNGKSIVTQATSQLSGATTTMNKDGSVETKVVVKDTLKNIETTYQVDGTKDGKAIHTLSITDKLTNKTVSTEANSDIAGAKTVIKTSGNLETTATKTENKTLDNGNIEEITTIAVVDTDSNGRSFTTFKRINKATGLEIDRQPTTKSGTLFEGGNKAIIKEDSNGKLILDITSKVNGEIVF